MTAYRLDPVLESLLDQLDKLAEAAETVFVIDSGTLLGLVRDGRLLPSDVDIDVSIVDAAGFARVLSGAEQVKLWRFAGRIYKGEIALESSPLTLDLKLFVPAERGWISPAIGTALPSERPKSWPRRLLRPAWRWMIAHGDAARLPLRMLARVDCWHIPSRFLSDTVPVGERTHCHMPADPEGYLAFRYGADWRVPKSNWISRRDDGGYSHGGARRLRRAFDP